MAASKRWTLALAGSLVFALGGPAWACRCREPAPRQAYSQAQAVILAEVEGVEPAPEQSVIYTLRVNEAWKTPVGDRVRVRSGSTCIFQADVGRSYVLFLRPYVPGMLQTSVCMGNRPVEEAGATLRLLRSTGREGGRSR